MFSGTAESRSPIVDQNADKKMNWSSTRNHRLRLAVDALQDIRIDTRHRLISREAIDLFMHQ